MNEKSEEENLEALKDFVEKNYWKVRNCIDYEDEYNECKSLRGRFQQIFLYGETIDCSQWKEDLKNCEKPADDMNAYASIIRHEDERMEKRLRGHMGNDVWKKRKEPPSDWSAPLPDFLEEKQKKSFQVLNQDKCIIS